jgi:hypothetical protein
MFASLSTTPRMVSKRDSLLTPPTTHSLASSSPQSFDHLPPILPVLDVSECSFPTYVAEGDGGCRDGPSISYFSSSDVDGVGQSTEIVSEDVGSVSSGEEDDGWKKI